MTYLTTGKRDIIRNEYQAEVNALAKHFRVTPPIVAVRGRRGGHYRALDHRLSLPPGSERSALVHEFAHHIAHLLYNHRGHGAAFRIALVQVATVAYGRADLYPWQSEYKGIASWATRHGMVRS